MFGQAGFDPWRTTMMPHLSHGSTPQAPGLALWSCGMVLARSWALPAVRRLLAAHGGALLAALGAFGAAAWDAWARDGPRLDAPPGGLHVAGPRGGRLESPRADPDGSAPGGQ